MNYEWHIQDTPLPPDDSLAAPHLQSRLGKRLYYRRFQSEHAHMSEHFAWGKLENMHDPSDMPELYAGAECVHRHLENKSSIGIFPDYDVDGICGGVLLYQFLKTAYPDNPIEIIQSDRFADGYGLHESHAERLINYNCVITVDCGSSSLHATELLAQNGTDVVITDHHECALDQEGKVIRPHARAFINPKRPDSPHYYSFLSGTGVTFMLCIAMRRVNTRCAQIKLAPLLDLVCTSIISDSVPLVNENRMFVQYGLKIYNSQPRPFFRQLIGPMRRGGPIDETALSFLLIPKLNAPGRLGTAELIYRGLMTRDEKEIQAFAKETLEQNKSRMEIQHQCWELIEPLVQNHSESDVICIYHPDIHEGVLGIMASRVSEITQKITIVLCPSQNPGEIKGSGRTYGAQSVLDVIQSFAGYLKQYGGHHAAIGLIVTEANLEPFIQSLINYRIPQKQNILQIEEVVTMDDISIESAMDIRMLGPYGQSFPEPCFLFRSASFPKLSLLKENHLKGVFEGDAGKKIEFVAWKLGHVAAHIGPHDRFDLAFKLKPNYFFGAPKPQCEIVDIRPHEAQLSAALNTPQENN